MKYRYALLVVLLILLADQCSKIYIKTHFHYGEDVAVLGNWFRLHFIENNGMAFGMRLGNAAAGKLALTLFRLVAVVFGFIYLKRLTVKGYTNTLIVCVAMILAGAAGNLIDSIFYGQVFTESSFHIASFVPFGQGYAPLFHGRVVDMLYFPLFDGNLPEWVPYFGGRHVAFFEEVFNIADASISIGVGILVVFQKRLLFKQPEKADMQPKYI